MKITGIYKIICTITNDMYIGSAINFKERWRRHKKDLRKNKHHSIILQRAWNKYGESNFEFSIIEECSIEVLIPREQFYIDSMLPIYNICRFAGNNRGRKDSDEVKERKRKIAIEKGIKPPESTWKDKQKKVIMLDDNLNSIQEFESLSSACRFIGKDHRFVSCITRAIKLKTKSYNYYWNYAE